MSPPCSALEPGHPGECLFLLDLWGLEVAGEERQRSAFKSQVLLKAKHQATTHLRSPPAGALLALQQGPLDAHTEASFFAVGTLSLVSDNC